MKSNQAALLLVAGIVVIIGAIFIFAFTPLFKPKVKDNITPIPNTKPIRTTQKTLLTPLPTLPHITTITVTKDGFSPNKISAKVGEIITWKNESGEMASINSDPVDKYDLYPELNLGQFNNGSSVQVKFSVSGTYTYHNYFHNAQKGTIIVE